MQSVLSDPYLLPLIATSTVVQLVRFLLMVLKWWVLWNKCHFVCAASGQDLASSCLSTGYTQRNLKHWVGRTNLIGTNRSYQRINSNTTKKKLKQMVIKGNMVLYW